MSAGGHGKGATKAKGSHGKKHGAHDEEHENHERWLVSYADMMTLLMVLFIVLFAISQVDKKKFAELKNGLAVGFGSPSTAFDGGEVSLLESSNESSPLDIASGIGGTTVDAEAVKEAVDAKERAKAEADLKKAQAEVESFEKVKQRITESMQQRGLTDSVRFTIDERGLVVTVVTSSVVFEGGEATLLGAGRNILDGIGPAIAPLPNRIEVDGHTNQLAATTGSYPSGWELSSARASTVVRYLNATAGIPESRLLAAGYADTKPLYPADDPRATTLNRRVEIIVLSNLPADSKALLPAAVSNTTPN